MKKRIGLIITIIVVALMVCLLIWRFWPRSFSCAISENSFSSFSAYAMVSHFENGQSNTTGYTIAQQDSTLAEMLEILSASDYRQDFRNLLPWDIDSVGSDKNYDSRTVTITLFPESQEAEPVQIQFLSPSIITVSGGGRSGFHIYHPTNDETLDKLVAHLQSYGDASDL